MKKLYLLMTLLLAFVTANATSVTISGSFTGWGDGTAMTEETPDTKYVLDVDLSANEDTNLEFKVRIDGGWSGGSLTLGTKAVVGSSDVNFKFANSFKKYKFVVEKENDTWYITVTGSEERGAITTQVYLAGTMNSWAGSDANFKFTIVDAEKDYSFDWDATEVVDASFDFKLVIGGSWFGAVNDNSANIVFGEAIGGNFNNGPNFVLTNTYKKYNFKVVKDGDSWKLTVTGTDARDVGPKNTYTATFDNAGNWAQVYAYTFSKDGETTTAEELGAWPGKEMTKTETGYSIEIEAAAAPQFIIFHNNDGIQTEDLAFENGKAYSAKKDFSVKFKFPENYKAWDKVYAYTFGPSTLGEWPGTEITSTLAEGVYTATFSAESAPENIIFNSGKGTVEGEVSLKGVDQTEDLAFENGKTYEFVPKQQYTATFKFGEGVTAWDEVYAYAWTEDGNELTPYTGEWPGEKLEATDGVYTLNILAYEAPKSIQFNDGKKNGVKTDDLAFENGKAYTYAPEPEPQPEAIEKMYIVGELTGGWPVDAAGETPADWSMAKEMTQDAENADIWTLTIEGFEAEAKIYKYKAAANQKWTVYTLPAEGNNEFEFGTEGYPAGKYNLTFTVNTKEHSLTLTAQKVEEVKPIIPDGTYYVMNSNTGAVVNAEGAIDVKGAPITFAFDATAKTYTITGAEFFAGKQWTVANMYDDMPGYFAITTVVEGATKYLTVDADSKLTLADVADDNAVWIVLEKAYWEDIMNSTYTIAGTKNLTGTENDWDIVKANQMKYNEETQLFEITYKGITVTNDVKPEFKVVKTPMEGEKTWFPTGDNSNWVITPEVLGGEGEYDITITFDPSDAKEIKVSGLKIEDITISPESGADIFETLIAAEMNKLTRNITINLAEGGNYTISGPLTAYANFEIQGNGATIDASGLNNNFIQMAVTDDPNVTIAVEYVSIHNATIKGLKKPLFHSTQKGYLINWLTIDNSIVEVAADVTSIDFTKGSAARNFNIEKSTIYAPAATTKSFYSSQAGQKLTDLDAEGTQTFIIKNSTLYNLAKTKNFFTHRQNSQKWLAYNAENSIFVNCGKSGQTIKGLNGGGTSANPTWTITGNAFNFEADGVMTDTSAGEATGDDAEPVLNSVAGVITFTDVAAGDFSGEFQLADGATKPEALGDARWTINFKGGPLVISMMYIVGDFTGGFPSDDNPESWSVAKEMTQSTENAAVWTLTLENQSIEGKAYYYKAAANGNWNDYVLPYGLQNAEFVFGTEDYPAGVYNLTFTVNTEEHTLTLVPTPVSDGISSVRMTEAVKNGEVYNLNGQRVAQPTKGLYIINGRKVVVK